MKIAYDFYSEEQGFVCSVDLELDDDYDWEEWEVEEIIAEDLLYRQWDWEGDVVWGVYKGNEIRPVLD